MIFYKTFEERQEFKQLNIRVKALLHMVASMVWSKKRYCVIVTDCLRTTEEDKALGGVGIHPTGRAIDFNFCDLNQERIFDSAFSVQLMDEINTVIPYGYGHYKTLIFHDVGAGDHFHLQVSRNRSTEILDKTLGRTNGQASDKPGSPGDQEATPETIKGAVREPESCAA